jgi:hypothetical protein
MVNGPRSSSFTGSLDLQTAVYRNEPSYPSFDQRLHTSHLNQAAPCLSGSLQEVGDEAPSASTQAGEASAEQSCQHPRPSHVLPLEAAHHEAENEATDHRALHHDTMAKTFGQTPLPRTRLLLEVKLLCHPRGSY